MFDIRKYVDMDHPDFIDAYKKKGDFGIWELVNEDVRSYIVVQYMGDRIDAVVEKLGMALVKGMVVAVKGVNGGKGDKDVAPPVDSKPAGDKPDVGTDGEGGGN